MVHPAAVEIIRGAEGLRLSAYLCPAGIPTIGYGATLWRGGGPIPPGAVITLEEAEALLARDLSHFELKVRGLAKAGSEAEMGALISFAFNLGPTALACSTLLKRHNSGDRNGAASQFGRWVNAGGVKLPGLVRRREAERLLYLGKGF